MSHSPVKTTVPITMTVADVAAYLRLSPSTVYRMTQRGDLPGIRVGGCWRFHRTTIEELLRPEQDLKKGEDDETMAEIG